VLSPRLARLGSVDCTGVAAAVGSDSDVTSGSVLEVGLMALSSEASGFVAEVDDEPSVLDDEGSVSSDRSGSADELELPVLDEELPVRAWINESDVVDDDDDEDESLPRAASSADSQF
jgi:hypothetical protein